MAHPVRHPSLVDNGTEAINNEYSVFFVDQQHGRHPLVLVFPACVCTPTSQTGPIAEPLGSTDEVPNLARYLLGAIVPALSPTVATPHQNHLLLQRDQMNTDARPPGGGGDLSLGETPLFNCHFYYIHSTPS